VSGQQSDDAYRRQRQSEAEMIEARCPGWIAMYGRYSRLFWAFGAPDGVPVVAESASELLGRMRAAERASRDVLRGKTAVIDHPSPLPNVGRSGASYGSVGGGGPMFPS